MFTAAILTAALSAPVPKSLRPVPTDDGVWELVEFVGLNGGLQYTFEKPSYCRIEKGRMSSFRRTVEELKSDKMADTIYVRDEKDPRMRTLKDSIQENPAMLEVDGDTLRWCYGLNPTTVITECKPGKEVYYYEFKRVKPGK